jgi:hypothetical protein
MGREDKGANKQNLRRKQKSHLVKAQMTSIPDEARGPDQMTKDQLSVIVPRAQ